jgi:polysaccharide export outer membrane protein
MNTSIRFLPLVLGMLGCVVGLPAVVAQPAPAPSVRTDEKKYIPYRIARGDRLAIAVFGEADLTAGGKKVEATGTVALTLIGEVRLVGLTIVEAQALIENAYRDGRFLRNPQVTVTVEESVPRWVSISGKINLPGKHEMPTDTVWTLKDLIIKAGGLQETASGRKVRILRIMPDGSQLTFEKDVDALMRGRKTGNAADASFPLEPEDIVYVPEKVI